MPILENKEVVFKMVLIKILYRITILVKKKFILIINFIIIKTMKVNINFNTLKNINGKIFIRNKGFISIKNNVIINSNYVSNPIGGNNFTSIIVKDGAKLIIEEGGRNI